MKVKKNAISLSIGFCIFFNALLFSQNQKIADSLLIEFKTKIYHGEERMSILQKLAFNELNNLDAALEYSDELITLASKENDFHYLYEGYLNRGNTHRLLGNVDLAIEALFKCSEVAKEGKLKINEAVSYVSIADLYSEIGNSKNAESYYDKGITILRTLDRPTVLASALFNAGDEFFNSKKYDAALKNYKEAEKIFESSDELMGKAYTLGNLGMVYAEKGEHISAESKIDEAINILKELEDFVSIAEYLTYMSDIYVERGEKEKAIEYAKRSLQIAKKNGIKKQLSETNLVLSELYEQIGNTDEALRHHKNYIIFRDSIINIENVQKAFDERTEFELGQQKIVYDLQKKNQRIIIYATALALILIGLLALGLYRRNKFVQKTNKIIAKEKERSDQLLLNILPEETAQELKEKGKVKAKKYDSVSVLFTDFKGFTKYAENLPPEKLVEAVDFYFSKFDEIIEIHGLEKIKTIGDAYMCAGGLNNTKNNHAHQIVEAAIDMKKFVKATKDDDNVDTSFDIRIGISTGPIVAGVVGTRKFAYDIWGDTVNIAARMESNSLPGKINISHETYKIIKEDYDCEFRGVLAVKNRSDMKMYFVNG